MKSLTLRLPDSLISDIESEARRRQVSKSDVMRERLERGRLGDSQADPLADIRDLIGSVDDPSLPSDVSTRVRHYLKVTGFGRNRSR